MRLTVLLFLLLITTIQANAQEVNPRKAEILAPQSGDAIRGIVPIQGNTDVEGFISWEISFGYEDDSTGTWFLIDESTLAITDDLLTDWDTTTITDGNYNLRLTVFLVEGRRTHYTLRGIRIRNYSSIETITPDPTLTHTPQLATSDPSKTPTYIIQITDTPLPQTPTPMPTNPLVLTSEGFSNYLLRGVAGTFAFFITMGLYITVRKAFGNLSS
jgi:hypothetical protein